MKKFYFYCYWFLLTFAQIEHGLLVGAGVDFLYKIVGNELLGVMNQIGLIGTIIS